MNVPRFDFVVVALAALLLPGCVSQVSVENKPADMAAASDPLRRAQARTALAAEYYQLQQYGVALEEATTALKHFSGYVQAHNLLGLIYMELRLDDKAIESFEEALRLAPGDSETLNNYGWFICDRGNPKRAMSYFQNALRNPLYSTPELAHVNAGTCALRMGDEAEGERNLRLALQRAPFQPQALFQMAQIEFRRGRAKEAEVFLTRHARVQPSPTPDVLLLGVRVSRALGDKSSEQSYLQQLRRRFPESPQIRLADPS